MTLELKHGLDLDFFLRNVVFYAWTIFYLDA